MKLTFWKLHRGLKIEKKCAIKCNLKISKNFDCCSLLLEENGRNDPVCTITDLTSQCELAKAVVDQTFTSLRDLKMVCKLLFINAIAIYEVKNATSPYPFCFKAIQNVGYYLLGSHYVLAT